MKTVVCAVAAAALLVAPVMSHANKKVVPLAPAILAAKTIYIDNQSTDPQLQDIASLELNKWGHFQLAESRAKADIVLRLTASNTVKFVSGDSVPVSYNSKAVATPLLSEENDVRPGYTRLTLIEPKTGNALWTDQRKIKDAKSTGRLLDSLRDAFDHQDKAR
jgi:hypothetical protein